MPTILKVMSELGGLEEFGTERNPFATKSVHIQPRGRAPPLTMRGEKKNPRAVQCTTTKSVGHIPKAAGQLCLS